MPSDAEFWKILWAIVAVGGVLRVFAATSCAVEHFDEGVYASNLWFTPAEGYRYPDRHLYAPPLVPTVLELAIAVCGSTHLGPIVPGTLAATLGIVFVGWLARLWFDKRVGLLCAALAAGSGVLIAFSPTALTEPYLLLLWPAGLVLLTKTVQRLESGGPAPWPSTLAAGIVIGLAWLTKYSGWLPLAIFWSGSALWSVTARPPLAVLRQLVTHGGVATAIAVAMFAAYVATLQDQGGYAAVAANHAQYAVGFAGWLPSATAQVSHLAKLESFGCLGFLLFCGAWQFSLKPRSLDDKWLWVMVGIPLVLFPTPMIVAAALAGVVLTLRSTFISWSATSTWGLACALTWVAGLAIMTPTYTPYPRLLIPLWLPVLIWAAAGFARLPYWFIRRDRPGGSVLLGLAFAAFMIADFSDCRLWTSPSGWVSTGSRLGLAQASDGAAKAIRQDAGPSGGPIQAIVYVYAEPAAYYHLSAAGLLCGPVSNLAFAAPEITSSPVPVYLVLGPHADRTHGFAEEWSLLGDRFTLLEEFPLPLSLLVTLDEGTAAAADDSGDKNVATRLRIYRCEFNRP